MWYLGHFSLTPFDEKYTKIPFEFLEYSYVRFMSKYGDEDIRDDYLHHKREEKKKQKAKEELEAQRGQLEDCYSKEETDKILSAFADIQLKKG